jgi:hypothetical protein
MIFVPSKAIMRNMIRAVLRFGRKDEPKKFVLRFGLVERSAEMLNNNKINKCMFCKHPTLMEKMEAAFLMRLAKTSI